MGVRGIFISLVGTVVAIVVTSIIIELFNMSTTTIGINTLLKMSARGACNLYSQETYKERDGAVEIGGMARIKDLEDGSGLTYISGKFYPSGTSEQVYNSLYRSYAFRQFMRSYEIKDKGRWRSLELLNRAVNNPSSLSLDYPTSGSSAALQEYIDSTSAKNYADSLMTPLNVGVPYLDKGVLTKMFRWNLAMTAGGDIPEAIEKDGYGSRYIGYKGFRIYADKAKITNLTYKVFNLENPNELKEFNRITHIDGRNLGFDFDKKLLGTVDDERKRVCIVGVEYSVPLAYEGITPIKSIFEYIANYRVKGLEDTAPAVSGERWNDSIGNLEGGGIENTAGDYGSLARNSKLIFYVIR